MWTATEKMDMLVGSGSERPRETGALRVPSGALSDTWLLLRERANGQFESLVYWVGRFDGSLSGYGWVAGAVCPRVVATELHVHVPRTERIGVARFLREKGFIVLAEIHTHMEEAFLSPVDAAYPLVGTPGFIQIVVPYFATRPEDWRTAAIFMREDNKWTPRGVDLFQGYS